MIIENNDVINELAILTKQHNGILLFSHNRGIVVFDSMGEKFVSLTKEEIFSYPNSDLCNRVGKFFDAVVSCGAVEDESSSNLLPIIDGNSESQQQNTTVVTPSQKIQICIDQSRISAVTEQTLNKLLDAFSECDVRLRLFINSASPSWVKIFDFVNAIRKQQKRALRVDFEGCLYITATSVLDQICLLGIVINWPILISSENEIDGKVVEAINNYAMYGIPVLIALYIGNHIPSNIVEMIDNLMIANLYSGFSIYPENYYCQNSSLLSNSKCSSQRFTELLARIYKVLPHYDVNFSPLLEIADVVSYGGWNKSHNIPRFMGVRVAHDGSIGIFRQNPNRSQIWCQSDWLLSASTENVWEEFLKKCSLVFTENAKSSLCQYVNLCGGVDSVCSGTKIDASVECESRSFFIESFLWQKALLDYHVKNSATEEK